MKKKIENSQKIIITSEHSKFQLSSCDCLTQAVLPQAWKGGAGRKVEGREGQEHLKPALPSKAASTVNTDLLPLIHERASSLKTKPTPSFSSLHSERKGTGSAPCHPFPCRLPLCCGISQQAGLELKKQTIKAVVGR